MSEEPQQSERQVVLSCLEKYRTEHENAWGNLDAHTVARYLSQECSDEDKEQVEAAVESHSAVAQALERIRRVNKRVGTSATLSTRDFREWSEQFFPTLFRLQQEPHLGERIEQVLGSRLIESLKIVASEPRLEKNRLIQLAGLKTQHALGDEESTGTEESREQEESAKALAEELMRFGAHEGRPEDESTVILTLAAACLGGSDERPFERAIQRLRRLDRAESVEVQLLLAFCYHKMNAPADAEACLMNAYSQIRQVMH